MMKITYDFTLCGLYDYVWVYCTFCTGRNLLLTYGVFTNKCNCCGKELRAFGVITHNNSGDLICWCA